MDLVKRQAQPADHAVAVTLMHAAAPEMVDFLHGGRAPGLAFLEYEFLSEAGFCSHRNLTVLTEDSGVIATAALTDHTTHAALVRETVLNTFKHHGFISGFKPLLRVRKVKDLLTEPVDGELYLANFAVREDLRAKGFGRKFINMLIGDAREAGYQYFTLDVSTENPNAEALYRSVGMEVIEIHSSSMKGVPGGKKMSMPLSL